MRNNLIITAQTWPLDLLPWANKSLWTYQTLAHGSTTRQNPTYKKQKKEIKENVSNHDLSVLEAAPQFDSMRKSVQSPIVLRQSWPVIFRNFDLVWEIKYETLPKYLRR